MESEPEVNITPEKTPALFDHALNVYNKMFESAGKRADQKVVYTGFLSRLMKDELKLSTPLYTHVTQVLRDMGCIVQLKRGGGGTPSVWQLIGQPTEKKFFSVREPNKAPLGNPFPTSKYEELIARISELDRKFVQFEELNTRLTDAMMQQGTTIQRQQGEISELRIKLNELDPTKSAMQLAL